MTVLVSNSHARRMAKPMRSMRAQSHGWSRFLKALSGSKPILPGHAIFKAARLMRLMAQTLPALTRRVRPAARWLDRQSIWLVLAVGVGLERLCRKYWGVDELGCVTPGRWVD